MFDLSDERIIIALIFAFSLGWVVAKIWYSGRQFKIEINKETGQATIKPLKRPKQKMEFLGEITQKELEDIERPTPLQEFFGKFKKPAKKEEEEEEI